MQADLTRPIIGIENRTAQEVFDIMCDRIRSRLSASIPAEIGELVERMEDVNSYQAPYANPPVASLCHEAASALRALSVRNGELREALEPFSKFAGPVFERNFNKPDTITSIGAADGGYCTLTAGDFFAARVALSKGGNG